MSTPNQRKPGTCILLTILCIAAIGVLHPQPTDHTIRVPQYLHKANAARVEMIWNPATEELVVTTGQMADELQLDISGVDGLALPTRQAIWNNVRPGDQFSIPVPVSMAGSGRLVARAICRNDGRSNSRIAVFPIGASMRKAVTDSPVYFGGTRVHVNALPD